MPFARDLPPPDGGPMKRYAFFASFLTFLVSLAPAFAGGAWVPAPGQGEVQLGYSRKTASSSWDASGDSFVNTTNVDGVPVRHYHDFRYGYLSGEIGVFKHLSAGFLMTYLHGLEGPKSEME